MRALIKVFFWFPFTSSTSNAFVLNENGNTHLVDIPKRSEERRRGEGQDYSGFQLTGEIEGFFVGLNCFDSGIYCVEKFGKYFDMAFFFVRGGGGIFCQGIFWGFVGSPLFDPSPSLEIRSISLGSQDYNNCFE